MKTFPEKLENYRKNLRCIQEVTEELLSRMKGHDWSFQAEVTDKKGGFSREKLQALVEELLSLWEARLAENTDIDPATGKNVAEPYVQERRELYGLYLWLVMRSSLCQGGYTCARSRELNEKAGFAFVLEQAKRLSRDWCVIAEPDGTRRNELYWGFDAYFGFHLYYALHDPGVLKGCVNPGNDWSLTPDWKRVCDHDGRLTNEGNLKRIHLKHSAPWSSEAEAPKEAPVTEEEAPDEEGEEPELPDREDDPIEGGCGPAAEDDDWYFPFPSAEDYYEFQAADRERRSDEDGRAQGLALLAAGFEGPAEYCSACERFAELFETAKPQVLRDFYRELEEIVDLYLAVKGIAPLTDTDKALNVYSRIYDGPYRQAKRYGRGLKWDSL